MEVEGGNGVTLTEPAVDKSPRTDKTEQSVEPPLFSTAPPVWWHLPSPPLTFPLFLYSPPFVFLLQMFNFCPAPLLSFVQTETFLPLSAYLTCLSATVNIFAESFNPARPTKRISQHITLVATPYMGWVGGLAGDWTSRSKPNPSAARNCVAMLSRQDSAMLNRCQRSIGAKNHTEIICKM